MTSTTSLGTDNPRPPAPPRTLRRSRSNRVGAGVAAGLGEYFGFDPVLFRVLFATAAFFGGAGIVAYVLAWAAIPEEGTERAPIDGWIARLRHRRVPVWAVAVAAGLLLWLLAFSWWVPHFFVPIVIVVLLLAVAFARQNRTADGVAPAVPTSSPAAATVPSSGHVPTAPVDLTKPAPGGEQPVGDAAPGAPAWRNDAAAWVREAKAASAARRRRAAPVRLSVLVVLLVTLASIGTADAVRGVLLPVYFWVTLGIVGAGLLVGLALRRTPWSLAPLLIPSIVGLIAFGGTRASLHDGVGQQTWAPTSVPTSSSYRLAFGQGVLDLRNLTAQSAPTTIDVTMAAGQVQILAPKSLNVVVAANVRFGAITASNALPDGYVTFGNNGNVLASGFGRSLQLAAPSGANGAPITVDVHLADGQVDVRRTG
jgi:phage shock protein PspC (stress-responsive transcriptional regulator)/FtsH-binding integral membrane protein